MNSPRIGLDTTRLRVTNTSRLTYAPAFLVASTTASLRLQRQSLQRIIHAVDERKRRKRIPTAPIDFDKLERLVAIYDSLRLFYPRSYLCMFDSLSLIEFLALYGMFPTWVFGAMADPFMAHCWVQEDDVILNDTVTRISNFTPIMSV